jgi:hypothetical protein
VVEQVFKSTYQSSFDEFVPELLNKLFEPSDRVHIGVKPHSKPLVDEFLLRDDAVQRLIQLKGKPNLFFTASSYEPGSTEPKCCSARAFCVDVDYCSEGHSKQACLAAQGDAYAALVTAPVTPSCIWSTGHGIQAIYLLDSVYPLTTPDQVTEYDEISRQLAAMVKADVTVTANHPLRVPYTLNEKSGSDPVGGTVLWGSMQSHALSDIVAFCGQYGIPPGPSPVLRQIPLQVSDFVEFDDLPQDLQDAISEDHRDCGTALFRLVARMARQGYSEDTISEAMKFSGSFTDEYGPVGINDEVRRCLDKMKGKPMVSSASVYPLDVPNQARRIRLSRCQPLSAAMEAQLDRYANLAGFSLSAELKESVRFHEYLFSSRRSGVMESPCGSGKSMWAMTHISLNASETSRFLYVVDTVEALYRAAKMIEDLNPALTVGRYHSFNQEKCRELCGNTHNWKVCSSADPKSVCHSCGVRDRCAFHTRDQQIQRGAVVMCHNGLVRLLESGKPPVKLDEAKIIVDEDLDASLTAEFTLDDLRNAEQFVDGAQLAVGTPANLRGLLPFTRFANPLLNQLLPDIETFASLNYVCRDAVQTTALAAQMPGLRKAIRRGRILTMKNQASREERARQTLCEIVNFFRPGPRADVRYVYREIHEEDGRGKGKTRYLLRKNRFDLDVKAVGKKLWILNASAQLSPTVYPSNMPVFRCPDMKPNGHLVSLYVIARNPTQNKTSENICAACLILRKKILSGKHQNVFIATNKDSGVDRDLRSAIQETFDQQPFRSKMKIITLPRGRIRGSNEAGECTFAVLAPMSLFSTLDSIAMRAVLSVGRTVPVVPNVLTAEGIPAMPRGQFQWQTMGQIYALTALNELYQTLWRTAVRNNQPVEAIVVIPDAEWLSVLWRTVMPGFKLLGAYKLKGQELRDDPLMTGLVGLMGEPVGVDVEKNEVAQRLGYGGKNPWKENKEGILSLLGPFFEEGSTNRCLRRNSS